MIPRDPVMLLSYVNTQLRDHYGSLGGVLQRIWHTGRRNLRKNCRKLTMHTTGKAISSGKQNRKPPGDAEPAALRPRVAFVSPGTEKQIFFSA